jgi:hypothetical protein
VTELEEAQARVVDSARSVISVINHSLTAHARHAADLVSRSSNQAIPIDPLRELTVFSNRALKDGATLFRAIWDMLEFLAWEPGQKLPPSNETPPVCNPRQVTIGPALPGDWKAAGLRRRGEPTPTIAASLITVTRNPVDPSQLDLAIEAGGADRGLYEGTLTLASAAAGQTITYNIYVDW